MKSISLKLKSGLGSPYGTKNFRSLKTPVCETASFDFESLEQVESAFRSRSDAYVYLGIPILSVSELENRLKLLSGAVSFNLRNKAFKDNNMNKDY